MRVIIVHSHLNPGGVTRIIESQVDSLHGIPVKVVAGSSENPEKITSKGAELRIYEPLNYLEIRKYSRSETQKLLEEITACFENLLTHDSVLHVHNLNLGKNPVLTYAIYKLAQKGIPVFNHAHDFAEDRPVNYQFLKDIIEENFDENLKHVLYPDFPNYHFGVLNSFDYKRLVEYGVDKQNILLLPNPVTFKTHFKPNEKNTAKRIICKQLELNEQKLLITYPVRVIERKNIGEFILLSVLFRNYAEFVVTQPPKNPVEIKIYQEWVEFCASEKIEICFEAGNKVNFEQLLVASDFCITTSYREGFGMVYLEPWLLNTPVVGRNIRYLTKDFEKDGFVFSTLYDKIIFPDYPDDFKNLPMKIQMQAISEVVAGNIKKEQIFEQNPVLDSLFKKVPAEKIEQNISIIRNNYSLEKYGIKLQNRYKKMVGKTGAAGT